MYSNQMESTTRQPHSNFIILLDSWNKRLKVFTGILNIHEGRRRVDVLFVDNHHYVGIGGKGVNKTREFGVAHFQSLKLSLRFADAEFELFDNVRDLFKAVRIRGRLKFHLGNDQKGGPFKQHDFGSVANRPNLSR